MNSSSHLAALAHQALHQSLVCTEGFERIDLPRNGMTGTSFAFFVLLFVAIKAIISLSIEQKQDQSHIRVATPSCCQAPSFHTRFLGLSEALLPDGDIGEAGELCTSIRAFWSMSIATASRLEWVSSSSLIEFLRMKSAV